MLQLTAEDLPAARERLAKAANFIALGNLVAEVAHELNNSLTGVLGFSQLLESTGLEPDQRLNVERLRREASRTAEIVNGVLSLARPSPADFVPVDMGEILRSTIRCKAYHLKVANIEVETRFTSIPPQVLGNATQMQSVFLNIINNAQDAMMEAHGRATLRITTAQPQGRVLVTIEDDGPGIEPEVMQSLFDPFVTTKATGTGLGLSICRDIIDHHGGRIWLESDYGHGATSFVELPCPTQAGPMKTGARVPRAA